MLYLPNCTKGKSKDTVTKKENIYMKKIGYIFSFPQHVVQGIICMYWAKTRGESLTGGTTPNSPLPQANIVFTLVCMAG